MESVLARPPEFNIKTRDLLAKRSGYICSNPDCRKVTAASNLAPHKATIIGEAAHISGARVGAARYDTSMTDYERSLITNAIWLCNSCHKRVDDDPKRYSSAVLFRWREIHDEYTIDQMDNKTDVIRRKLEMEETDVFAKYPPIIRRIVLDRPNFWEGELTKELLDHLLLPLRRKHEAIRSKSLLPDTYIVEEGKETKYIRRKMAEAHRLVSSLEALYAGQLVQSWGPSGESGDAKEILAVCELIERTVNKAIEWECELEGVFLEDDDFVEAFDAIKGAVGLQIFEILKVNDLVADIVQRVRKMKKDEVINVEHTIVFSLPADFNEKFDTALEKIVKKKAQR